MSKSRYSLAVFLCLVSPIAAHAADEGEAVYCKQDLVSMIAELEAFGNLNASTKGRDVFKNMGHWTDYTQCDIRPGQDGTSVLVKYYVHIHPDNVTVFVMRIANFTGIGELFGPFQLKDFE